MLTFFGCWERSNLKNPRYCHADHHRHRCHSAVRLTAIGGLGILFLLLAIAPLLAVPVVPNESLVTAEVVEQDIVDSATLKIEPKQELYRWKLRLIKVEAVQNKANFLAGYEGKSIEALSKEAPPVSSLVGKTIKARVSFRGDEKNGRYWLVGSPQADLR